MPPEFNLNGASIYLSHHQGDAIGVMHCIHGTDGTLIGVRVHVDPFSTRASEAASIQPGEWFALPPGEDIFLTVDQIRQVQRTDGLDFEYTLDLRSA